MIRLFLIGIISILMLGCGDTKSDSAAEGESASEDVEDVEVGKKGKPVEKNPVLSLSPEVKEWYIEPGEMVGLIKPDFTEEDIIGIYGKENVIRKELGSWEGEFTEATIVFPDSEKELKVYWEEDAPFIRIDRIRVDQKDSKWKTIGGITIDTPLERILEVNGGAFSFYGFEWDYAGLVNDWNGGTLPSNFQVILQPENPSAIYPDLLGDRKFSTDHPKVPAADLRVLAMYFYFDQEDVQ